ncbi:MAG: 4'-phosphopantetheinyl transferase superfamily protein [Arcicella sp.]|nr:4'-phosphopantetheinyl transferase superfamily protein [Arcicella sp.]
MLIFSKNISAKAIITLWKIEENPSFFLEYLGIDSIDLLQLSNATHPTKQLEWLASRTCVKYSVEALNHAYYGIAKDEHNNPYLIGNQGFVSLSHTNEYAVAVVSFEEEVGIDIERISDKLSRVAHKFLSLPERLHAGEDLFKMCIYWCAKESLYKWYGKKNLSFKNNIYIEPFEEKPATLEGEILVDGILKTEHQLAVFYVEDFVITVVF